MAKAMIKRGTEDKIVVAKRYCSNCGEWSREDQSWSSYVCLRFAEYERWTVSDGRGSFIFNSEDSEEITVWQHDPCDTYFVEEPDYKEVGGPTWVCGSCGWESTDKQAVMRCCL